MRVLQRVSLHNSLKSYWKDIKYWKVHEAKETVKKSNIQFNTEFSPRKKKKRKQICKQNHMDNKCNFMQAGELMTLSSWVRFHWHFLY